MSDDWAVVGKQKKTRKVAGDKNNGTALKVGVPQLEDAGKFKVCYSQ